MEQCLPVHGVLHLRHLLQVAEVKALGLEQETRQVDATDADKDEKLV